MTDDDLARIEALTSAAEPGPWLISNQDLTTESGPLAERGYDVEWPDPATLAFIAAARFDVPALAAEVRRLRAELADTEATYDDCMAVLEENDRLRDLIRGIREGDFWSLARAKDYVTALPAHAPLPPPQETR